MDQSEATMAMVEQQQNQQPQQEEIGARPETSLEDEILLRAAANHLFLAQFEPFRATLKTLSGKNPQAALAMLRAVVSRGGRVPGIALSPSVPSPAHLAWMCALELQELDIQLHSIPQLGLVRKVAEMLLLLEQLETEVCSSSSSPDECTYSRAVTGERFLEKGFTSELADFYVGKLEKLLSSSESFVNIGLSEESLRAWVDVAASSQPGIMAAVCENVCMQREFDEKGGGEDDVGGLLLRLVQGAFLKSIRSCITRGNVEASFVYLRYLDERAGVEESEFSEAISLVAESCLAASDHSKTLLSLAYESLLASRSNRLLSVLEASQDNVIQLEQSVELPADDDSLQPLVMPPPFWKLHQQLEALRNDDGASKTVEEIILEFRRDIFHYARVKGELVLELATRIALAALKANRPQIAADVLAPFPRLQSLVTAMGWDLLRGNTEARRRMMELLWLKNLKLGRELPAKDIEEVSCIDDLCNRLWFNLEISYFVSDTKAGIERDFKGPLLLSEGREAGAPRDDFGANLVLERLSDQSALRVIFDVNPDTSVQDAFNVVALEPISSSLDVTHKHEDFELLHMHVGLQAVAAVMIAIAAETQRGLMNSLASLDKLEHHLKSIKNPARRVWLLSIVVHFLQMDERVLKLISEEQTEAPAEEDGSTGDDDGQLVVRFIRRALEIIDRHLPSPGFLSRGRHARVENEWKLAWEEKRSRIKNFVAEWNWRLSVLEELMLLPEVRLSWKSALRVMHSTPLTILNMCIQRSRFDLAQDAIQRFGLPLEDAALLQLVQWLHNVGANKKENELDVLFSSKSMPPVSSLVLCLDVAATYSPSVEGSRLVLEQAQTLLSQASQQAPAEDEIQHFLAISKRLLNRLSELLEQGQLPVVLSGADVPCVPENLRQSPKQRGLTMLHQIIDDAHNGKGQFLSGKLHNLVKALADEAFDDPEKKQNEQGIAVGLGFKPLVSPATTPGTGAASTEEVAQKPAGKRYLGVLANKPTAYLSAFMLYVATIGDIIDGVDTTHDFNFFSLLYERPADLLTKLVFEKGSTDGASKLGEIMGVDVVHQVVSACVPPVFPPGSSNTSSTNVSENDEDHPAYRLDVDIVKFLSTLSPVRAILASVFGNRVETLGNDFSVEQAERFPILQRWIQMQSNLQTLRDSSMFTTKPRPAAKRSSKLKRYREFDDEENPEQKKEAESVVETVSHEQRRESSRLQQVWEDEYPYEEAVEGFIKDGKLVDALAFADRWLKAGAPDKLLQLLIERGEDSVPSSSHHQNLWNSSWQYCIRLKDKRLAATLALKYFHRWELDAAIDVLTMCSCHLPADDVLFEEVLRAKKHLQQYRHILREDSQFQNWQEVESLCQRDPEGLALRLAEKGAVTAALDIAESFKLSDDLRRELQGRQLVKLLTADPINGGGPAEAIRFLGSLNRPEDALPVAMAAMEQLPSLHSKQLPSLHSKQLLVHFLLKRQMWLLSEEEHARLDRLALGLKMLGALPLPWQQRCSALHEHPQLILETLLMWKQFQAASQLLEAFPQLRNDKLIITYAAKAIYISGASSYYPPSKAGSGNKLTSSNGTGRRAFTWNSRDTRNKIVPKDNRKRKSALPPSQKAAWEAMAGYQEDRPIGLGPEGYEKLAPLTMADEWVLSGDPVKDEAVRSSHKYESAPSFALFKALMSLCGDQAGAAKSAVELAVSQVQTILSAECLRVNAASEAIERAFHAAGTFVQVLLDARTQVHKILGNIEASSQEASDASKAASGENQSSLTKLLSEADLWLNRVELLHFLLGSGFTASVEDVSDENAAVLLRDRLIQDERYGMGVYTCTKCKIDVFPVWEAWGFALLRIEHYAQARLKFKKALQLYKDDPVKIVQKIVDTMESCPPVDVPAARSLYVHMAKSVSSASDDSLSADSYLNVLYIPTFTRAERSRKFAEEGTEAYAQFTADEITLPLSNLDSTRYEECKYYLEEYACQLLLAFMFRHGRYTDACLVFFPVSSVPPAPAALSSGSSKLDTLATEYGSVDDLCELCVAYGAVPNLVRVIEARGDDPQVAQHTSAALNRICLYFDNHRHFNHLYRFQLLKKDYIAAGLCCIQLFLNASTQDQALRHLERAKVHFEEGLAARQQALEQVKSSAKVSRGKSPSEKLTDEDLIKYSARVTIQMEVVRCFSDADGPPWKRSLFGNPSDNDTFKRRCEIAEALVEKNFDLAFQIIYDFGLPAVYIYAGVAAALAERRKYNNLTELLRNIKGTIDNDDLDQIIGAAISVYASKHRERPDRLIDMLTSNHRKVLACGLCGRLKSAFQIASRSGSVADVQWVAQQARMTGALPVEDMCKQWLARSS